MTRCPTDVLTRECGFEPIISQKIHSSLFCVILCFCSLVSHCSPSCSVTLCIIHTTLKLEKSTPASASQLLELWLQATILSFFIILNRCKEHQSRLLSQMPQASLLPLDLFRLPGSDIICISHGLPSGQNPS